MAVLRPRTLASTATLALGPHHNRTFVFDTASGSTVTLPVASGSGAKFRFVVTTTVTSNSDKIQVANATDVMIGNIQMLQDAADTIVGWEAASTSDTITLNGTTTGGLKGDWLEIEDVKAGNWLVRGLLSATGTEATPFSAAVS
jgi:hypothetical protein